MIGTSIPVPQPICVQIGNFSVIDIKKNLEVIIANNSTMRVEGIGNVDMVSLVRDSKIEKLLLKTFCTFRISI